MNVEQFVLNTRDQAAVYGDDKERLIEFLDRWMEEISNQQWLTDNGGSLDRFQRAHLKTLERRHSILFELKGQLGE